MLVSTSTLRARFACTFGTPHVTLRIGLCETLFKGEAVYRLRMSKSYGNFKILFRKFISQQSQASNHMKVDVNIKCSLYVCHPSVVRKYRQLYSLSNFNNFQSFVLCRNYTALSNFLFISPVHLIKS